MLVQHMRDRNYLAANDVYLKLAIGNAPWPIGALLCVLRGRQGIVVQGVPPGGSRHSGSAVTCDPERGVCARLRRVLLLLLAAGVTQVGLHERSAREKISHSMNATSQAHIMNDEGTRKYFQVCVSRLSGRDTGLQ
jgi:pre-mRNA-splicing factor 18